MSQTRMQMQVAISQMLREQFHVGVATHVGGSKLEFTLEDRRWKITIEAEDEEYDVLRQPDVFPDPFVRHPSDVTHDPYENERWCTVGDELPPEPPYECPGGNA